MSKNELFKLSAQFTIRLTLPVCETVKLDNIIAAVIGCKIYQQAIANNKIRLKKNDKIVILFKSFFFLITSLFFLMIVFFFLSKICKLANLIVKKIDSFVNPAIWSHYKVMKNSIIMLTESIIGCHLK